MEEQSLKGTGKKYLDDEEGLDVLLVVLKDCSEELLKNRSILYSFSSQFGWRRCNSSNHPTFKTK